MGWGEGSPFLSARRRSDTLHRRMSKGGEARTKQLRIRTDWLTLAKLLVGLTVIAYLPALRDGFVFDDGPLIIMNRLVRAHDGLYRFWFTTEASDYYPLTGSLWWLQWRVFGYQAIGYHAVNILLHAANAILVWLILLRLKVPGAWLAGAIFALHPVNVATVAWISEQKSTLSMLFSAVAILLYLRFYEDGRWRWYGFSLTAFLLALLSKSAVVMLPLVLLGCVWWMRRRLRSKDWLRSVPFFVLSLALGLVTVWFQHHRALQGHLVRSDGFPARLAAAGWVPWFYLYKALLPVNLTLMYPKWSIDASRWILYVPGALLIVCFLVFWRARRTWGRPLLFGLGYFLVMLFPVLGILEQGFYTFSLVADHWQYYSIIGVIALAVATGESVFRRIGDQHRWWEMAVAIGMLALLGAATWQRCRVYATDETLWEDTVARNPQEWHAYINLGAALKQSGKLEAAVGCLEQALRLEPGFSGGAQRSRRCVTATGKVARGDPSLRAGVADQARVCRVPRQPGECAGAARPTRKRSVTSSRRYRLIPTLPRCTIISAMPCCVRERSRRRSSATGRPCGSIPISPRRISTWQSRWRRPPGTGGDRAVQAGIETQT